MAFVKLDCGILDSTLWPDREAREMFITALLMAEPIEIKEETSTIEIRQIVETQFVIPVGWYGFVPASGAGIARRAGLDGEDGLKALERLAAPDQESRTPDFEGRRLARVDGGFIVLNYDKYRQKDHTSAERSKRYRERKMAKNNTVSPDRHAVTTRSVTQAEAEAEAEVEETRESALSPGKISNYPEAETPSWDEFWAFCNSQECLLPAEWYAKDKFEAASSQNWSRMQNWKAYARRCKAWWESDGRPMAPRTKGDGKSFIGDPGAKKAPSVYEITKIIEAKKEEAKGLFDRHASEGPLSTAWNNEDARDRFRAVKAEIKALNAKLGGMA